MKKMIQHKKILVFGLGASGCSAADFLLKMGVSATGFDDFLSSSPRKQQIQKLCREGLKVSSSLEEVMQTSFDLVVVSPGISKDHPLYQHSLKAGIEVIGEIELAARFIPKTQKCLAVTGTNGKTTVTLLADHALNTSGISSKPLGNVGDPLTKQFVDLKGKFPEVIVLELSSYQLETLKAEFIDAAVILNITPDHLDRHQTMQNYAKAKMRIAKNLKQDGVLYIEEDCLAEYGELLEIDHARPYGFNHQSIIRSDKRHVFARGEVKGELPSEYKNSSSHDVKNFLSAFALCEQAGLSYQKFVAAARSFQKPPHRIEFVRKINEVSFIDDSKGTNLDSVIKAVQMMQGSVILIAGGVHKGASYKPWIKAFDGKVRQIYAIGEAKGVIEKDLSDEIPVSLCTSLEEAVKRAAALATPGETVLLSPGCSSYDMFRDYAHRGNEFKKVVDHL